MILKFLDLSKKFPKNQKFYLLYGSNTGLIEDTINDIFKPKLSKNIYNYDENEVLAKTDEFKENILNNSFFEIDKLIIINRCTDKILKIIEDLIIRKISETVIIIKSDILEKKSKLRNFFEKNKDTICVPFYEDNYNSLQIITQKFFSENKIKFSIQNINYIIEKSKKNRTNLKNDLEKIKFFLKKNSTIEFRDIVKLTNSPQNYEISELTDQYLLKNKKKTIYMLNENTSTYEDNLLILKSLQFKLKRLKKLNTEVEKKKDLDLVISSYKPSIFWKDKDIIKQQLQTLTMSEIKILLKKIIEIEFQIKQYSNKYDKITNNFILNSMDTINSTNSIV